jgi:hypothetical protein
VSCLAFIWGVAVWLCLCAVGHQQLPLVLAVTYRRLWQTAALHMVAGVVQHVQQTVAAVLVGLLYLLLWLVYSDTLPPAALGAALPASFHLPHAPIYLPCTPT